MVVYREHDAMRLDGVRKLHEFAVARRKIDVLGRDDADVFGDVAWVHVSASP